MVDGMVLNCLCREYDDGMGTVVLIVKIFVKLLYVVTYFMCDSKCHVFSFVKLYTHAH